MILRAILKKTRQVALRRNCIVQSEVLLCLALMFGGGLAGCSTNKRHASMESSPDIYLHLYASYIYPELPRLIVSVPIRLSSDFDILMDGNQHLTGCVEPRNGKLFVRFQGILCSGMNVFEGETELEKREEPWPEPYDVKAPFICQLHFVLSVNADPKPFLRRQAAAEKERWHLENPLTSRQLKEVKRKFRLLQPGMTETEVFAILGLSRYQNRLFPGHFFRPKLNRSTYQLADGEILILDFDFTGYDKTNRLELPNGEHIMMLDLTGTHTNRLVIRAQLGLETWPRENGVSNAPPGWH